MFHEMEKTTRDRARGNSFVRYASLLATDGKVRRYSHVKESKSSLSQHFATMSRRRNKIAREKTCPVTCGS